MAKPKSSPDVLYKYYAPERIGVFDDLLVRFSQLAALNDPFEFLINVTPGEMQRSAERMSSRLTSFFSLLKLGLSGSLNALRTNDNIKDAPWPLRVVFGIIFVPLAVVVMLLLQPFIGKQMKRLMRAAATEFENAIVNDARRGLVLVFSCSERWDCVPMWAHYAANHEGFVLGLDPSSAFVDANPKAKRRYLVPRAVRYQNEQPRFTPDKMGVHDFVCSKMLDWSYEKEWRYVQFPDFASERATTPAQQEVLLFPLEEVSIKEVVFGAACSRETASAVISRLSRRGLSPTLWQVRRSPGYGFVRVLISDPEELETVGHGGPVPSIIDRPFTEFSEAMKDFETEALAHPIMRKLYESKPSRPLG